MSDLARAYFTNACLAVAMLGALRIFWLGLKRYKTDARWQLVMLGGLLLTASYIAVIMLNGGPASSYFFMLTTASDATAGAYVLFLKVGLLLAVFGAFSVAKTD